MASTLCAFANMPDGGTIILGVDEQRDFAVTGVAEPAVMEAGLVSLARSAVTPAPTLRTSTVTVTGKQVVVAEVAPLRLVDRPAMTGGRAYLRQADGDYVMHEHELRLVEVEKIKMAEPLDYDRQPVSGLTIEDLVPDIVHDYLTSARLRDRRLESRSDSEILRRTGLMVASGEPTLAGLYAAGDYPQGQFPSLTVTAAVQLPTGGGARNADLRHFTGPIPVLLDEVLTWCRRNLTLVRAYRADGHMVERPEIPLSAVRELVANALVHRDLGPNTLGVGKGIQVRLTPTNLMVLSPGGLRGVSVEQLERDDHAQAAVNQRLYSIAQKLSTEDGSPIIEGEGGGIREVFRSAEDYGLRAPTLVNTGVQVKALLWRPESGLPPQSRTSEEEPHRGRRPSEWLQAVLEQGGLTRNEPLVLTVLDAEGPLSLRELQSATELTEGQLRYALHAAQDAGLLRMVGKQGRKDTRYELIQD